MYYVIQMIHNGIPMKPHVYEDKHKADSYYELLCITHLGNDCEPFTEDEINETLLPKNIQIHRFICS